LHGFNERSAACGQNARHNHCEQKESRGNAIARRVKRSDAKQHGAQQTYCGDGAQASGQIPGLESSLDWIDSAARALVQVEQGMRRNLLRSLSLDAMAVGLSRD